MAEKVAVVVYEGGGGWRVLGTKPSTVIATGIHRYRDAEINGRRWLRDNGGGRLVILTQALNILEQTVPSA